MSLQLWIDLDSYFADDIRRMDEIVTFFKTTESKTTTRVGACRSIVSHDEVSIVIYDKIVEFTLGSSSDSCFWKVEFF